MTRSENLELGILPSRARKKMSLRLGLYKRWFEQENRSFISYLEHEPGAKVIDLGCGDGEFTIKVEEKIGCNNLIGVDVFEYALNKAKVRGLNTRQVNLDKRLPFTENSFDVVVSHQVIEHLFFPVKFIKEVYRILKPKGYAIIGTENLASLDNISALILGYTPFSMEFDEIYMIGNPFSPHERETIVDNIPHVRIFTRRGLHELAKHVGFNVEKRTGRVSRFIVIKARK